MTENELPYFGGCPRCRRTDGYVNVRSAHWFVCDTHLTKWCPGCNLFSDWRDETMADWWANADLLETYTEVEPVREAA